MGIAEEILGRDRATRQNRMVTGVASPCLFLSFAVPCELFKRFAPLLDAAVLTSDDDYVIL